MKVTESDVIDWLEKELEDERWQEVEMLMEHSKYYQNIKRSLVETKDIIKTHADEEFSMSKKTIDDIIAKATEPKKEEPKRRWPWRRSLNWSWLL